MIVVRARGDREWPVHRLNDFRHGDGARPAGQAIAAPRALHRNQQVRPDQPLQHLGEQFERDFIRLGNLARAARRHVLPGGEVFHRHECVIRFFR